MLREIGEVTTVGFGAAPEGVAEHIEVPAGLSTLPQTPRGVFELAFHRFRSVEMRAPAVAWARTALEGRRFDLVVANEARVLALATEVAGDSPLWADMHEWAPEERTHILSWRLLVAPFMTYLCAQYLPSASLVTTVGGAIADLYLDRFGVTTEVMRNAGPHVPLTPKPSDGEAVRLVHSGAAIHGRHLELMIDAMALLDERFTLDLYLVSGGDGGAYLRQLRERAGDNPRIVFRDPVAPGDLPSTLNEYDVGVFWIPPTHTNARLTLPNKFFDYVQARLVVAVGPSAEMEPLIKHYGLGVISAGFTAEECADSIRTLDVEEINRMKDASDVAAKTLSFEHEEAKIRPILESLLPHSPAPSNGTNA